MGFIDEIYRLQVTATLSNHNSENDVIEAELWEEIEQFINTKAAEIEAFIQQPRYSRITPHFF